ncbi:MAG TPA: DUF2291 family protein [Pirellulales bacterium]|jgi:predicted lipoprotein
MSNAVAPPMGTLLKRWSALLVAVIVAIVVFAWFFPLFHIIRLDDFEKVRQQTTFDATARAQEFWQKQLLPAVDRAADVQVVLAMAAADPKQVRKTFGHTVGDSRAYYLFLRGIGTVAAIEADAVVVEVEGDQPKKIRLETGPLFGNTVRDSAGLLNPSEFSNSQQMNDLSIALNKIVETKVISEVKTAKVGDRVQFVGGAAIKNETKDFQELSIVPIKIITENK